MPLTRHLRPAPDPEDPDTTGVAFRPREKEGVRRMRSNNKKTYNLMASLHEEFTRLKQICELVKRRERQKLELHVTQGEYTEAQHRALMQRLHRQRTGQGMLNDGLDENEAYAGEARPIKPLSHKKGAGLAAQRAAHGMSGSKSERSHHKKREPGSSAAPQQ